MTLNLDKSTWRPLAFADVIENMTERVDDPSRAGVDRYVGLEHLDPGVLTVQRWATPDLVEAQKLRFYPHDVIFGRRRAYQKKVAMAEFEGICSAHALVLRAKPDLIHPDFLPHFLTSDYFLDRAVAISVGSLSPTVNWRDLKVEQFDLPPLDEQKRLADLLWATQRHYQRLVGLATSLATGYDNWIGARLADFSTRPLGELVELQHGRPVPSELYGQGDFPLLRPGDMKPTGRTVWSTTSVRVPDSFASANEEWILEPGDLVINMTAQSLEDRFLGRVCRMHSKALLNQRIGRLRPRDLSPEYLFLTLRSPAFTDWVARRSEGSKVKHMHWRHIVDYPLPMPDASTQRKLVTEAAGWSTAADAANLESDSCRLLKASILAEVFGGAE